jgi:K+-transporting ATPase ATPase C chain
MKNHILISLRMTIVMVVLTCAIYPGAVFAIAQLVFPHQANGSFVSHGSALIGQSFASERFFHSRPSASSYDGMNSGGTNLGPTSKKLRDAISAATKSYDVQTNVPRDAVTSSASGLDPHISPENAYAQGPRVARANRIPAEQVNALVARHTESRFLGVFGEPRVNVLLLNLDVAERRWTPVH